MNSLSASIRETKTRGEVNKLRTSGEAVDRIKKSRIKKLVITDTIDNSSKIRNAKNIEVLTISNLLAEAIKRISNSTSVSDLFK